MDYHFVSPDSMSLNQTSRRFSVLIKKLSPVLIISAILPIFLFLVYNPPDYAFSPRADVNPTLRVWFKPAQTTMNEDSQVEIAVFASFDNSSGEVIRSLSFDLITSSGVHINPQVLVNTTPFSGQQQIGNITVRSTSTGTATVGIDETSINVEPATAGLEYQTGTAEFKVN